MKLGRSGVEKSSNVRVGCMRVLHLPSTFFPKNTGGKEVFVYQLVKGNPEIQQLVVYHQGAAVTDTTYQGIPIRILPPPTISDYYESYWSHVYDDLPGFKETLEEFKPDLVHFHDFCAGASLSHLRACRSAGVKTLVTYHSPGNSCLQKGLIRANRVPCDGKIIDQRCTACRYQTKGIPSLLANVMAAVNIPINKRGNVLLRHSTERFHRSFNEFFSDVDAVQVHASWVRDLLISNQVTPEKIKLIPMGGHPSLNGIDRQPTDENQPLKIVLLGRNVNIKGSHILIEAVKRLPLHAKVEVHFFGPDWDDSPYGQGLRKSVEGDMRFMPPRLIPPENVVQELSKMDVCVIPSLWPETGPLSLFDAFAAGVPVIGTNHAGIAERIQHQKNGLLFAWGDSEDLARQLKRLLDNRDLLIHLRQSIGRNRTFVEMASDIKDLYRAIVISR